MESNLLKFKIERTAHVYSLGELNGETTDVWIVFHGYGQLASRIIKKFNHLELDNAYILAPEGISKFYFKRDPLILGASWMSSQHREDEIEDYLKYIDAVYDSLPTSNTWRLNVLGFSQGCTTMMRWLDHRRPNLHKLVMWAGQFPHDMQYEAFKEYFNTITHRFFCVGDSDEFVTPERFKILKDFLGESEMNLEFKHFNGKHVIDRTILSEVYGA